VPAGGKATAAQSHIWRLDLKADYGSAIAPCHASVRGHRTLLLPFWGQRAPAFRQGGEWPSPLPLLEHPCSTACRRTGADPVGGGLRASALCTPCRVVAAFRWASRQRVQQARSTPVARRLAIHPQVCWPSIRPPARSGPHPPSRPASCRSAENTLPFALARLPTRTPIPPPRHCLRPPSP